MSDYIPPYIIRTEIVVHKVWNKEYNQDAECVCGHPYYRHFDTYEDMSACGCKYCSCYKFGSTIEEWEKNNEAKFFIPLDEYLSEKYWEENAVHAIYTMEQFRNKSDVGEVKFKHCYGFPIFDGKVCPLFHAMGINISSNPTFEPDGYLLFNNIDRRL